MPTSPQGLVLRLRPQRVFAGLSCSKPRTSGLGQYPTHQYPCCLNLASPAHCPYFLTQHPEITGHVNHLCPGPHFRLCFRGTQN